MKDIAKKSNKAIASYAFSGICFTGIIVCLICNLAISHCLSWALIPVVSICFLWLLIVPAIILWKKATYISLLSLSAFIIPYLYIISNLIGNRAVFSIGSVIALVSVAFLWVVYAVFKCLRKRKSVALGITFLSAVLFVFVINLILYKMIAEPVFDIWDLPAVLILLTLAVISFIK